MITHDANIANHAKKVLHIFDGEIVEDKERKEKQQFRSALELLKLIESALDEEEGENHEK